MALRNCEDCTKLFDAVWGARRCRSCLELEEAHLHAVRLFVKDNPGVAVSLVEEATGVPEDRIRSFLRSGLLEGAGWEAAGYPCRRCQRPISKGEFCPFCAKSLSDSMGGPAGPVPLVTKEKKTEERSYSFVTHYRQTRGR